MCVVDVDYFKIYNERDFYIPLKEKFMNARRKRELVSGFGKTRAIVFDVGDILNISCQVKYYGFGFVGICLSLRKKNLKNINVCFKLRNVVYGVAAEVTALYFPQRLYKLNTLDYKRKAFYYKRSKLYYLRFLPNSKALI